MSTDCALTIVVAVKDAAANLADLSTRLGSAASSGNQLLFVFAGPPPDGWTPPPGGETLSSPENTLIPELWRDGILRARGKHVALTSAHCLPSPDWVATLLAADLQKNVGVGGVIELDPRCSPVHKSIYLLRYLAFAPPQRARAVADIAADNAIYRRAEIMAHPQLLAKGFWEPSFHRRFATEGLSLCVAPAIRVGYRGRELAGDFARQRLQHGREYGESRSRALPLLRRVAYLLASPLVPFVILTRVTRRAFRGDIYLRALPVASPWLLWFIASWSIGEIGGYLNAVLRPARGEERS
ncbi:MAG: hypothetical protein SGJ21_13950 [Alphaproteobacteria bacterium]|nr:hypothetical protein [Alphaproteobacteria bacterium]